VDKNQIMTSELIAQLVEDDTSFMDFIEDSIELLLKSERSYIICSKKDLPSIVVQLDEEGISVAFLSELQGS